MALVIGSGLTIGSGINIVPDVAAGGDPYYANVSLLLTGQGTAGSSAIADSSKNAWSITNGSSLITYNATSPQIGTTSMRFPGTGNYLRIANSGVATFGSGNFTIEGWFKLGTVTTNTTILWLSGVPGANAYAGLRLDTAAVNPGFLRHYISTDGGSWLTTGFYNTTALTANTWFYYTLVRVGTTLTVYLNGTADGTYNIGANVPYSAADNWIGAKNTGSAGAPSVNTPANGYIEQLRITTGVARYTTNFTVPNTLMPTS